jgi:transcription elongation factor Elf1
MNRHQIRSGHLSELVLVPNTDRPLRIPCPKCQRTGCTLVVKSISDMTAVCPNCSHSWATELEALPEDIQQIVRALLKD